MLDQVKQILIETTDWSDALARIPNHTYYLNKDGKAVAYMKEGTDEIIEFKKPMMFDKRYRTFKKKVLK